MVFIDTYYLIMAGWRKRRPNRHSNVACGRCIEEVWFRRSFSRFDSKEHVDQYCAVYQATDKYLVGGQQMADCFEKAFGARYEQLLSFGSPRLTTYRHIDRHAHQQKLKNN